eukprot:1757886-Alexandrium_andersonii.AAC.1
MVVAATLEGREPFAPLLEEFAPKIRLMMPPEGCGVCDGELRAKAWPLLRALESWRDQSGQTLL